MEDQLRHQNSLAATINRNPISSNSPAILNTEFTEPKRRAVTSILNQSLTSAFNTKSALRERITRNQAIDDYSFK